MEPTMEPTLFEQYLRGQNAWERFVFCYNLHRSIHEATTRPLSEYLSDYGSAGNALENAFVWTDEYPNATGAVQESSHTFWYHTQEGFRDFLRAKQGHARNVTSFERFQKLQERESKP